MKKTNLLFKKVASFLSAGLMLVSFVACSSPAEPKPEPEPEKEPEPIVDTFVSERVTTKNLSTGVEFTFEKKAGDEDVLQIFITENNEIHLQLNANVSEKIEELNKKGKMSFTFPFTEAKKESVFNIWYNCGTSFDKTTTHDGVITVTAEGGKGKSTKFYDKTSYDKIGLALNDANKSKFLYLTLPAGKKDFNTFIKDETTFTAKSLNIFLNRVKDNNNDFITNGVVNLLDPQGKKTFSELKSDNGTDIYNLFSLTKNELNTQMNGFTDYSTSLMLELKIDEDIATNCNLNGVQFFIPEIYSEPFPYTAAYSNPDKAESQHITLEKDKKGIKVTANWFEEDGEWYDTALIEKESGMGIYFSSEFGTSPTKENPTVTYYYIFTETGKSYTFIFASNTSNGGYHEEKLECTAGGGSNSLFTLNDSFNKATAEIKEDGTYKINNDICSIFSVTNATNYKDVNVLLTFNSGDKYWNDTQWAGKEIISCIKDGVIDMTEYSKLLEGKKIDQTSETGINLNKRDQWFMELNLLVQFKDDNTLYTIKNLKADSDYTQSN